MVVLNKNEYYFRHFPHQSCILDSNKIQKEYLDYIVTQSYESEKHKSLKNALMAKLVASDDPSINQTSICIEKFTDGRRADVYCERNGRKIAFEIQVSPLSLSIILARIDHYREKNINLFWVIECDNLIKKQFMHDIKTYGSSEHLYELSLDKKLLKCHFQAPQVHYRNGSLDIFSYIPSFREVLIDLSDLKLINNQPSLLNYDKEEKNLKILLASIQEVAAQQDLKALNDLYLTTKNDLFFGIDCTIINGYLSWLIKDPSLIHNDISYATSTIDFVPYIETFHEDLWQSKDKSACINSTFSCPKCKIIKNHFIGTVDYRTNKYTCEYCNYSEKDLTHYLADMLYGGNLREAEKEITRNLVLPYRS